MAHAIAAIVYVRPLMAEVSQKVAGPDVDVLVGGPYIPCQRRSARSDRLQGLRHSRRPVDGARRSGERSSGLAGPSICRTMKMGRKVARLVVPGFLHETVRIVYSLYPFYGRSSCSCGRRSALTLPTSRPPPLVSSTSGKLSPRMPPNGR